MSGWPVWRALASPGMLQRAAMVKPAARKSIASGFCMADGAAVCSVTLSVALGFGHGGHGAEHAQYRRRVRTAPAAFSGLRLSRLSRFFSHQTENYRPAIPAAQARVQRATRHGFASSATQRETNASARSRLENTSGSARRS